MKRVLLPLLALSLIGLLQGCSTPSQHIGGISLGMSPDEVRQVMGPPFSVRAAKMFDEGEVTEVWEYVAPTWSMAAFIDDYDKDYWVFFENGKVVQWGVPGDFSGDTSTGDVPVKEYYGKKRLQ